MNQSGPKSKISYYPKYHLLAFVDALGFHKEIAGPSLERAQKYFEITDFIHPKIPIPTNFNCQLKVTTIGDSIIFAIETTGPEEGQSQSADPHFTEKLRYLASAISTVQVGFAMADIWVRGAITFNLLHFSQSRIVGPAFHRAVYLESKVAIYPRVIIDGEIISAAGMDTAQSLVDSVNGLERDILNRDVPVLFSYRRTSKSQVALVRDVPTFVDFGRVLPGVYAPYDFINIVADKVSRRLKVDIEHYMKYKWIADYILHCMNLDPNLNGIDLGGARRLLAGG